MLPLENKFLNTLPSWRRGIVSIFYLLTGYLALLIIYLIFTGDFAAPWTALPFGRPEGLKKLREPALALLVVWLATFVIRYGMLGGWKEFKKKILNFTEKPYAIWVLFSVYAFLFVWNQLKAYWSLNIHFLPFEYHDYMVYWFSKGKWYYTGCLHGFYHLNTLLLLFVPIWLIFQSPLVLLTAHGLFLSLACIPLYFLARTKFKEPFVPFFIAFSYLNFKYLFHGLEMNFSPEGMYPLAVFSVVLFAIKRYWKAMFLMLAIGLLIKEDAPFYFFGLGFYFIFFREWRKQGVGIILMSIIWFLILMYLIGPMTGASQRYKETVDIYEIGETTFEGTLYYFMTHPLHVVKEFFYPWVKSETLFNFYSKLAFLPLFSGAFITTLAPMATMLLTRQEKWMTFGFHYALQIIPFAFIALTFGLANVARWFNQKREFVLWFFMAALVLLNIGNYRTYPVTENDRITRKLAMSLSDEASVVTLGHLLPYVGYRDDNCYFSPVLEVGHKKVFDNAAYALFAKEVTTYSAPDDYLANKIHYYETDERYKKVVDDGVRLLFKKIKNTTLTKP